MHLALPLLVLLLVSTSSLIPAVEASPTPIDASLGDRPADQAVEPAIRLKVAEANQSATVTALAFSPDSATLAVGTARGLLKEFNSATATERASHPVGTTRLSSVDRIDYAPGGETLAAVVDHGWLTILDAATGRARRRWETPDRKYNEGPLAIAHAPGGRVVATGDIAGAVTLWDSANGERLGTLPGRTSPRRFDAANRVWREEQPESIMVMAFSPDGSTLIAIPFDGSIRRWDLAARRERGPALAMKLYPSCGAVSLDGESVAVGYRGAVRDGPSNDLQLWDLAAGRVRAEPTTRDNLIEVAFLPDGRLVTLEETIRREENLIRLRDADGKELAVVRFGERAEVDRLAVSPDGRRIAVGGYSDAPSAGIIHLIEVDGATLRPLNARARTP